MEYKFNKIDTDIRLKIQKETSDKKVHYSKKTNKSNDMVEERKNSSKNFSEDKNKKNYLKRYVTIDGIKYGEEIDIQAEKFEKLNEENSIGRTIDMRK